MLAIIPARKNSLTLRRKNVRKFHSKLLIVKIVRNNKKPDKLLTLNIFKHTMGLFWLNLNIWYTSVIKNMKRSKIEIFKLNESFKR